MTVDDNNYARRGILLTAGSAALAVVTGSGSASPATQAISKSHPNDEIAVPSCLAVSANLTDLDTVTAAKAAPISQLILFVRVAGFDKIGDGGASLYKRANSQPQHSGKFQSVDGAWWEIHSSYLNLHMFGATGDGTTDDAKAI